MKVKHLTVDMPDCNDIENTINKAIQQNNIKPDEIISINQIELLSITYYEIFYKGV